MPNPASALIGVGQATGGGGVLGPIGNVLGQFGNVLIPSELATLDVLTRLWQLRHMNNESFITTSRTVGYDMSDIGNIIPQLTLERTRNGLYFATYNDTMSRTPMQSHAKWAYLNKNWPTIDETNVMYNRGFLSNQLYDFLLNVNTSGETGLAKAFAELRFVIPPITDLIRFTVKDVFTPGIVEKFGYNKEFPIEILRYLEQQGLTGELPIPRPSGSTTTQGPDTREQVNWADLYWWSHWDLPSPTQAYTMLHRLYFQSTYGRSPLLANSIEDRFTSIDLQDLLKTQDYPEYWRNKLELISYNPLTRVDTRRMFNIGEITRQEVYHSYRHQGYDDVNARKLLTFAEREKANYVYKEIGKDTKELVCKYYSEGIYHFNEAIERLITLGFEDDKARNIIMLCQAKMRSDDIKEKITYIRHSYYQGFITLSQVFTALANIGLSQEGQDRYVDKWRLKRQMVLKHVAANRAIKLFKRGFLTLPKFRELLLNLHYPSDEVNKIIGLAQLEVREWTLKQLTDALARQAKEDEKNAKAAATAASKAAAAAAAAAKAVSSSQEKVISKILAAYTEKHLVEWKNQGSLSYDDVTTVLGLKGWDEVSIIAFMEQYWPEETGV